MRVVVADKVYVGEPTVELEAAGTDAELQCFDRTDEVPDEAWRQADGIVTYRGPAVVNSKAALFDNCRIIVRAGVGYDGLDLAALGARGIAVCNVPDYGTTEVADHAMALMLALRRGIASYDRRLREAPAEHWTWRGAPCVARLRGRQFGVIGLGRIGMAAARRARAFDMDVAFFDPYLPDGVDLATGYMRYQSAEDLVANSDVVTVHTPLTNETTGLIGASLLSHFRPGAIVINTARGPVVDLDALYDALKNGSLGGAALDVLPTEPPVAHPLLDAHGQGEDWLEGRLILTPHAAFYSAEGLRDMRYKGTATVVEFLKSGTLRNCVNAAFLKRD